MHESGQLQNKNIKAKNWASRRLFLRASLQNFLHLNPTNTRYCIAFSGGRDSHILLHAATQWLVGQRLLAIHIKHGWHPESDNWVEHCQSICLALKIPFIVNDVSEKLQSMHYIKQQGGPEAAARQVRYKALAESLQPQDCLLTAHHEQDQAETVLLQLMRGSGLPGLSGMPWMSHCGNAPHYRPLLSWTSEDLRRYAKENNLVWIEDTSNTDLHYARNFIRHRTLPSLQERWPSAAHCLARTASHLAAAHNLLSEIALEDLQGLGGHLIPILPASALRRLSLPRRHNVLRAWLSQFALIPHTNQLNQIEQLLQSEPPRHLARIVLNNKQIRRYRDNLYILPLHSVLPRDTLTWDLQRPLPIAHGGALHAYPQIGQGIALAILRDNPLIVRFKCGGERLHPQGRTGSHPLKKLFQEWGVPPWERSTLPLLYTIEGQLVAVSHYAIAQRFTAPPGAQGVGISYSNETLQKMPFQKISIGQL